MDRLQQDVWIPLVSSVKGHLPAKAVDYLTTCEYSKQLQSVTKVGLEAAQQPSSAVPLIGLCLIHITPVYLKYKLRKVMPQIRFKKVASSQEFIKGLCEKSSEFWKGVVNSPQARKKILGTGSEDEENAAVAAAAAADSDEMWPESSDMGGMMPQFTTEGSTVFEEGEGGDAEDRTMLVSITLHSVYDGVNPHHEEDKKKREEKGEDDEDGPPPSTLTLSLKNFKNSLDEELLNNGLAKNVVMLPRATITEASVPNLASLYVALSTDGSGGNYELALDLHNFSAVVLNEKLEEAIQFKDDPKFNDGKTLRESVADAESLARVRTKQTAQDPRCVFVKEELLAQAKEIMVKERNKFGNPSIACIKFLGKIFSFTTLLTFMGAAGAISVADLFSEVYLDIEVDPSDTDIKNVDITDRNAFMRYFRGKILEVFSFRSASVVVEQARENLDNYTAYRLNNAACAEGAFGILYRSRQEDHRSKYSLIETLEDIQIWNEARTFIADVLQTFVYGYHALLHPFLCLLTYYTSKFSEYPYAVSEVANQLEKNLESVTVAKERHIDVDDLFDLDGVEDLQNNPERGFLLLREDVESHEAGDAAVAQNSSKAAQKKMETITRHLYPHGRGDSWRGSHEFRPKLGGYQAAPTVGLCLLAGAAVEKNDEVRTNAIVFCAGEAKWPGGQDLAPLFAPLAKATQSHIARVAPKSTAEYLKAVCSCYDQVAALKQPKNKKTKKDLENESDKPEVPAKTSNVAGEDDEGPRESLIPRMEAPRGNFNVHEYRLYGEEIDVMKQSLVSRDKSDDDWRPNIASSFGDRADMLFNRVSEWAMQGFEDACDPPLTTKEKSMVRESEYRLRETYAKMRGTNVWDNFYPPWDSRHDPVAIEFHRKRHEFRPTSILKELNDVTIAGQVDERSIDNTSRLLEAPSSLSTQCFNNLDTFEDIPVFSIEFKDVHFHYRPDRPILQGVSFKIERGHFVGLVGESGCGKSTIFALLCRQETPTSGKVLINGKDVRLYPTRWLRRRFGCVSQFRAEGELGNTLESLLLLPDPLAKLKDPDVVTRALQKAYAYEFVMERPLGLQSPGDIEFSGGQHQRIAIASALVKDAAKVRCYLFDESTSALDVETERKIQASIETHGRLPSTGEKITLIAAAHRLSTLRNCDKIIVFRKGGKISQQGTWKELMSIEEGDFAKFVHAQEVRDFGGDGMMSAENTAEYGSGAYTDGSSCWMGSPEPTNASAQQAESPSKAAKAAPTTNNTVPEVAEEHALSGNVTEEPKLNVDDNTMLMTALDMENVLNELMQQPGVDLDHLDKCFAVIDTLKTKFGIPVNPRVRPVATLTAGNNGQGGSSDDLLASPQTIRTPAGDDAAAALEEFSLEEAFMMLPKRVGLKRNEPKVPEACFDKMAFLGIQQLLPMHLKNRKWMQCYSSEEVGFSLSTMRHELQTCAERVDTTLYGCILVVHARGHTFGAFLPKLPDWENKRYTNNSETFAFKITREAGVEESTGVLHLPSTSSLIGHQKPSLMGVGGSSTNNMLGTSPPPTTVTSGGDTPVSPLSPASPVTNEYHYKCFSESESFLIGGGGKGPLIGLTEDLDFVTCSSDCPTFVKHGKTTTMLLENSSESAPASPANNQHQTTTTSTTVLQPLIPDDGSVQDSTVECGVVRVPIDKVELWGICQHEFACPANLFPARPSHLASPTGISM